MPDTIEDRLTRLEHALVALAEGVQRVAFALDQDERWPLQADAAPVPWERLDLGSDVEAVQHKVLLHCRNCGRMNPRRLLRCFHCNEDLP